VFDDVSPATPATLERVHHADESDVDEALDAARSIGAGYAWVSDVDVRYPGGPPL